MYDHFAQYAHLAALTNLEVVVSVSLTASRESVLSAWEWVISSHPVFNFQTRHPLEVPCVVGHQAQAQRQCMRGDLGVHLANRLAGLLQMGGNFSLPVCGLQRPWQHGQLIEQQINGSAAFVIRL